MFWERWFVVCCFAIVVLLGVLRILEPPTGDNAMFIMGASVKAEGGQLYTDYWDLKQPGIYYFYLAAGTLFGFNEIGIHIFELCFLMAFAIVTWLLLRRYFVSEFVAVLAPTLLLVAYFVNGDIQDTTQVEILVNFPILLSAWCIVRGHDAGTAGWRWFFIAGVLAGATLVFKLALVPIFLGFFLVSAREQWLYRGEGGIVAEMLPVLTFWIVFGAGVLAVFSLLAIDLWWRGNLEGFLYATFVTPIEILGQGAAAPWSRLATLLVLSISKVAFLLPLAVLAFVLPDHDPHRRLKHFMCAWLLFGLLAIMIQRVSWYSYHGPLLFGAVAVLAALGVDKLLLLARRRFGLDEPATVAAVSLGLLTTLGLSAPAVLERAWGMTNVLLLRTQTADQSYRERFPVDYARTAAIADLVRPLPANERIFVIGNPQIYLMLNARQATTMNAWSPEQLSVREFRLILAQLKEARPVWIFVGNVYRPVLERRATELLGWLADNYVIRNANESGVWYGLTRDAVASSTR